MTRLHPSSSSASSPTSTPPLSSSTAAVLLFLLLLLHPPALRLPPSQSSAGRESERAMTFGVEAASAASVTADAYRIARATMADDEGENAVVMLRATTSRVNFRMDVRPKDDLNDRKDLNNSSNLSNFDGSGGRLLSAKPKAKYPATKRRDGRERRATTGWSTSELFEFETAAAKLFHERLAAWHAPHASVAATSVHVRDISRVEIDGEGDDASFAMRVDSSVAVTYLLVPSRQSAGADAGAAAMAAVDVASALAESVAPGDIAGVLERAGLLSFDGGRDGGGGAGVVVEATFANVGDESGGEEGTTAAATRDTDGVYDTDVVLTANDFPTSNSSDTVNDTTSSSGDSDSVRINQLKQRDARDGAGWDMFLAGAALTSMVFSIIYLAYHVYEKKANALGGGSKEEGRFEGSIDDDAVDHGEIFEEDDNELEFATTASGVLGLKGHHPSYFERNNENASPNARGGRFFGDEEDTGNNDALTSPRSGIWYGSHTPVGESLTTPSELSAASSHRRPLGITSMRKLGRFASPTPPRELSTGPGNGVRSGHRRRRRRPHSPHQDHMSPREALSVVDEEERRWEPATGANYRDGLGACTNVAATIRSRAGIEDRMT